MSTEERPLWETDGRWRRLQVSNELLSLFLRGQGDATRETTAPADLDVIGLNHVWAGPNGSMTFIVWSATFEPVPLDKDGRLMEEIPLVTFEYRRSQGE